jgi:hypothetical protein
VEAEQLEGKGCVGTEMMCSRVVRGSLSLLKNKEC